MSDIIGDSESSFSVIEFQSLDSILRVEQNQFKKDIVENLFSLVPQELSKFTLSNTIVSTNNFIKLDDAAFMRSLSVSRRKIKNINQFQMRVDICEDYQPPGTVPPNPGPFPTPTVTKKYVYSGYHPDTGVFTIWESTTLGSKKPDGEVKDFKQVYLVE